jgi:hypothetical protein
VENEVNTHLLTACLLSAVAASGMTTAKAVAGSTAPASAPGRRAAVLVTCGAAFDTAGKLHAAGFDVAALRQGWPLTWDQAKGYNVIVVSDMGPANADLTLTDSNRTTLETLRKFMEAGGGVLFMPAYMQMRTHLAAQEALVKPLGLEPLFEELIVETETRVQATPWKIDFAHTASFADHPACTGLKSLWYPVCQRIGAQSHTTALKVSADWTVLVRAGKAARTWQVPLEKNFAAEAPPGTFAEAPPIAAARAVGKGRLVVLGIVPNYLLGDAAYTTLEGIVPQRGLLQQPSQGFEFLVRSLKWLAEPALAPAAGLGGAADDPRLREDPRKTVFGKPYDWPAGAPVFPAVEKAYPGLVGARSAASSGKGSVADWVAAGKAQGLAFVVFLEEFARLTPEALEKLKADCRQASTPDFAAIAGFTIDDEVGNHYLYFGANVAYPKAKYIDPARRVFISHDPEVMPNAPDLKGQLAMTTLLYAYSDGGFRQAAGNYLFRQGAAPFANFYSNWNVAGVITARDGKVVEDATSEYLELCGAGQGPVPVVVDLVSDPAQIGASGWRTVLRMPPTGGNCIAGKLGEATKLVDYWTLWHFYPDNPNRIYLTCGPQIESWCFVGPRDYEGNLQGDFAWPNYRWQLRGRVTSDVGLKEVLVLDGTAPFRRFLPNGAKEFEFTLDLTHDRQHTLVLLATDVKGGRAIGHEQWDRNHRLEEFNCADRNNQLSYGYQTRADGRMMMLGGNQTLATPNKRMDDRQISPSGTFKNDPFLGAPAFDGGCGGEPQAFMSCTLRTPAGEVFPPVVADSRRLLHTLDVNIGEGLAKDNFADGVRSFNVWHSLWRTEPARDFTVRKRNHFFQADVDSPLAVFMWDLELTLLRDLDTKSVIVAFLGNGQERLWALRGSDGRCFAGAWEDTRRSPARTLVVPFSRGAYGALLDSPLGGAAIFPLADGLEAQLGLPRRSRLYLVLPGDKAPHKAGDTLRTRLLLVGIPRLTDYTAALAAPSTETVETFARQFGLLDGTTGYQVEAAAGKVADKRFILTVDGAATAGFSGKLSGKLISRLPVVVTGLNDKWSVCLYDRQQRLARPVGMFEGKAWATLLMHGSADVFLGHPVTADDPRAVIQVTQSGAAAWNVEIHNPADAPITTRIKANPAFDPLHGAGFGDAPLTIPAGSSLKRELKPSLPHFR